MRLSETIPVPKMRRVQASDPIEDGDEKFSLAVLHSSRFPSLGWSHRLGRKFSGILSIFGTIFAVEREGGEDNFDFSSMGTWWYFFARTEMYYCSLRSSSIWGKLWFSCFVAVRLREITF